MGVDEMALTLLYRDRNQYWAKIEIDKSDILLR